jgi:hypothetical protein
MLLDFWDDLEKYQTKMLKRYDWMRKERRVLERL